MAWENPGTTAWYVSLSYARCMKQMRIMHRSEGFRRYVRHAYAQFPPRLELTNGSEICFRSADRPENLLGEGLGALAVDEGARLEKQVWEQYLLPMLADTNGRALVASTYNGKEWFYELSERGLSGKDSAVATYRFPTSSGIRFQGDAGRARLARLRSQFDSATWAQEFDCVPLAMSDAVFGSWVDRVVHDQAPTVSKTAPTCVAIDLGRTVDPSVMVTLQPYASGWRIVAVKEWKLGTEHDRIALECAEWVATFRGPSPCVVVDVTGGASGGRDESYIRFYRARLPGLRPINWTALTKPAMVGALRLMMEQRTLLIPSAFRDTIDQLKCYRYKRGEMSNWIAYGAPSGMHDDHVAACMMGAYAIDQNWISVGGGLPLSAAF